MTTRQELEAKLPELRPRLHRYCARMAGSVVDGEDVLQDALLKAFGAIERDAVENLEAWLFRIARNAAHDHLRARARRQGWMAEADMELVEDPSQDSARRHVAAVSLRTFMHLPVPQRSTVILVDLLEFSLQETCALLGTTLAATKAALHRGRARLRALAAEPEAQPALRLDAAEEGRLRRYVDLFNAREFDGIRALAAEDVQLDLVNRTRMRGKAQVSTYFGNYERAHDWQLAIGWVDERPAIVVHAPNDPERQPRGFMLLEWAGEQVAGIRDFRYAAYVLDGADIVYGDGAPGRTRVN